jgi:hypothetical protein
MHRVRGKIKLTTTIIRITIAILPALLLLLLLFNINIVPSFTSFRSPDFPRQISGIGLLWQGPDLRSGENASVAVKQDPTHSGFDCSGLLVSSLK